MKNNAVTQNGDVKNSSKIYTNITESMIELMESFKTNPVRWEKPWIKTENGLGAHNAMSKRPYSGLNQLYLSFLCEKYEYAFNRWLTFNQVQELGGHIKNGSKSALIVFFKNVQVKENNNNNSSQASEEATQENQKNKLVLSYYRVFNVSQMEGLKDVFYLPYNKLEIHEIEQIRDAEHILDHCGARIQFQEQDTAFYREDQDLISLLILGDLSPEQRIMLEVNGIHYELYFDLSYQQVLELYVRCDLLAYVSTYEGFGLPILEAQATGRPVITSNTASMPEVAGDAALFVDPLNVLAIRSAILQLCNNIDLREQLIQRGLKNVKRFHPMVIARKYADLYKEINVSKR